MPFPFTFSIAVPGLNPFSTPSEPHSTPDPSQSPEKPRARPVRPHNVNEKRPRPSPSPSPSAPVSRKRGWDPSLAEPSQSSATFASSSGYLDTPAKYRETAGNQPRDEFELEDMSASIPGACLSFIYIPMWDLHGAEKICASPVPLYDPVWNAMFVLDSVMLRLGFRPGCTMKVDLRSRVIGAELEHRL